MNTFSKPFQIAVGGTLSFEGGRTRTGSKWKKISATAHEVVRLSGTPWKMKAESLLELKA